MYSINFIKQKLDYIYNNPVEEGLVDKGEEYIYSSARDYYYGKKNGLLELNGFGRRSPELQTIAVR